MANVDGTYDVFAKTPLGKKSVQLVVVSDGDSCSADVVMGERRKHLDGELDGNHALFTGEVKLPFPIGKVAFTIEGSIVGDTLTGVCRTKKFTFDITGRRAA